MRFPSMLIVRYGVADKRAHLFDTEQSVIGDWTALCKEPVLDMGFDYVIYEQHESYDVKYHYNFPELCEKCKLLKTMLELAE